MIALDLELQLLSDAEPGTGLGTEALDSLVPRDEGNQPVLPATHIKGLLRDRLGTIGSWLADGTIADRFRILLDEIVGLGGESGSDGMQGRMRLADLRLVVAPDATGSTLEIHRTALSELGSAHAQSLRGVEAVAAGRSFRGRLWLDATAGDPIDLACRLGLMSIEAVGSTRTRGAGLCRIRIEGEGRGPGALLHELEQSLQGSLVVARPQSPTAPAAKRLRDAGTKWFRLCFLADAPVCCAETPVVGTNVIRSGPVIPASAVQGAILTLLSTRDPELASAAFSSPSFRAWPLTPIAPATAGPKTVGFGVRVDLAHRMSKLPLARADGAQEHEFFDSAVAPYHWSEAPAGSALKSTDGVLVRGDGGAVGLWRSQDLPRVLRTHGVHSGPDGTRNLFSVEALAPLVFAGLLAIPGDAAALLEDLLAAGVTVSFGKSRTVRGSGVLALQRLDGAVAGPWEWHLGADQHSAQGRVFVVQSPLALPDDWDVGRAEHALARLAQEAGWGELVIGDPSGRGRHGGTVANVGLRFGWNRHGLGQTVGAHRRLRARRVVLPGSVLVLREPLANLEQRLLEGIGAGREQGLGALLPHPGIASHRLPSPPPLATLRSDGAARLAIELWELGGMDKGPSASQIGDLAQRVHADRSAALRFLNDKEHVRRHAWDIWAPIITRLKECLAPESQVPLVKALRAWQDLRIAGEGMEKQRSK
ncbi:MAG: hypothetical protein K8J09_19745 [Planctomycetes bacterium]|nr:hypothetical protein [Planctomycetota bacterium]